MELLLRPKTCKIDIKLFAVAWTRGMKQEAFIEIRIIQYKRRWPMSDSSVWFSPQHSKNTYVHSYMSKNKRWHVENFLSLNTNQACIVSKEMCVLPVDRAKMTGFPMAKAEPGTSLAFRFQYHSSNLLFLQNNRFNYSCTFLFVCSGRSL